MGCGGCECGLTFGVDVLRLGGLRFLGCARNDKWGGFVSSGGPFGVGGGSRRALRQAQGERRGNLPHPNPSRDPGQALTLSHQGDLCESCRIPLTLTLSHVGERGFCGVLQRSPMLERGPCFHPHPLEGLGAGSNPLPSRERGLKEVLAISVPWPWRGCAFGRS